MRIKAMVFWAPIKKMATTKGKEKKRVVMKFVI